MVDQIQVNKAILKEQVDRLTELNDSTELVDAINVLDGLISQSSGESAEIMGQSKAELSALQTNMGLLFSRTLEFLENKHGDFVLADEG